MKTKYLIECPQHFIIYVPSHSHITAWDTSSCAPCLSLGKPVTKCQSTSVSLRNVCVLVNPASGTLNLITYPTINNPKEIFSSLRQQSGFKARGRENKKPRVTLFELGWPPCVSSNIKVTHHCLLKHDKVWINTHTLISAYTCLHGDKEPQITQKPFPLHPSRQSSACAGCASLAPSGRRPPAAKPLPHRWPWWKNEPSVLTRARQTDDAVHSTTPTTEPIMQQSGYLLAYSLATKNNRTCFTAHSQ